MIPGSLLGRSKCGGVGVVGLLVLIIELLNNAIETAVDRIGLGHHRLSGRAKDVGSAAVFLSMLLTGIVWSLIAWQNFA